MKISYFSVWDKKALSFSPLFPSSTPGAAERQLRDLVSNKDSSVSRYPSDYALFLIFDFDDESGIVIDRYEPPRLIVEASALVFES